jgi:hypothetical protein
MQLKMIPVPSSIARGKKIKKSLEEATLGETQAYVDFSDSFGLLEKIDENQVQIPQSLQDLENFKSFTSILSIDTALKLDIPFGAKDSKFSRRVFIQDTLMYKDITDGEQKVRYGVGVRWIVNTLKLDAKANISSLPFITASAEFGFVQATASFDVLGLKSAEIAKAIPTPTKLDIETYVEMAEALKTIKGLIYDAKTEVNPQLIAVLGRERDRMEDDYRDALATGWALNRIKDGKRLQDIIHDKEMQAPMFMDVVKSVYLDITGTTALHAKPEDDARTRAKKLLDGLVVK